MSFDLVVSEVMAISGLMIVADGIWRAKSPETRRGGGYILRCIWAVLVGATWNPFLGAVALTSELIVSGERGGEISGKGIFARATVVVLELAYYAIGAAALCVGLEKAVRLLFG